MTLLLEAVKEAHELGERIIHEKRKAIVRACEGGHSLREIGSYVGIHFTTVRYHYLKGKAERGETR